MNKIRIENIKANRNTDENFFVIDEDKYNSTYLSALFVINKDNRISKEAFGLTSVLLSFSAFANNSSSSSFHKINFDFDEGYNKYILQCSILEPLDKKAFIDSRLKMGRKLMRTFTAGWSKRDRDLDRAIEEITYQYAMLDVDPVFQLDRMMQLNYFPDLPLGRYPYGNLEKIKKVNHMDIELALEHLIQSSRMAAYVGNINYRFVLAARNTIKPSSKIFPFTPKLQVLPRGTNLEVENKKISGNYVGFAFNLSKVHSEKVKMCHDILLSLLFNKYNGVMLDYLLENDMKIIDTKLFLPSSCFSIYLSSSKAIDLKFIEEFENKITQFYKEDIEINLFNIKRSIESKLYKGFDTPQELVNNIYEGRLSGFDYSTDVLNSKLESIDTEDFVAYLKKINLVGSIKLEGQVDEK